MMAGGDAFYVGRESSTCMQVVDANHFGEEALGSWQVGCCAQDAHAAWRQTRSNLTAHEICTRNAQAVWPTDKAAVKGIQSRNLELDLPSGGTSGRRNKKAKGP